MIDGYWTMIGSILLIILVITDWGNVIHKYIPVQIVIPSVIVVWLGQWMDWKWHTFSNKFIIVIYVSFILNALLLIISICFTATSSQIYYLIIHAFGLAGTITIVKYVMLTFPWAGVHITIFHLSAIICGIVFLLRLRGDEYISTIFISFGLAELLLLWQQQGEYRSEIGSLAWWDQLTITLLLLFSAKVLLSNTYKIMSYFKVLLTKRMKS